ncbi:MAG: hypothetical protein ACKOEL_02890 [Planctomycetota bacterium]
MSNARLDGSALALRAFLATIGAAVLSGLAFIFGIVRQERWLLSGFILAGGCLLVFVQAWVADRGRHRAWMRVGMVAAALATAAGIASLWLGPTPLGRSVGELTLRAGLASLALAVWTAWGGVLTFSRASGAAIVPVRWGTFALITVWATIAVLACIDPDTAEQFVELVVSQDWFGRALGASAVVSLAGTIAQPILVLLARRAAQSSDPRLGDRHLAVEVRCPRCGAMPAIEANTDALCPGCRLSIRVVVDEPRCACGFLLYRLEGTSCPECGKGVADALRWRPPVTPSQAAPPSP